MSNKAEVAPIQSRDEQTALAREVLRAEADAVSRIAIGPAFHDAIDLILKHTGGENDRVAGAESSTPQGVARGTGVSPSLNPSHPVGGGTLVVTGLGKSGLIAQKLSATFVSTGTHSHYLHPTEAMHGDLGRIRRGDVVLALSRSGNTEEVVSLASILRQDGVPVIAITGEDGDGSATPNGAGGDLARLATVHLSIGNVTEACPMNLAPTASTTAMLALGDALALTVSRRRNFSVDDFHRVHPGGSLGRQLMPVTEAMRFRAGDNLPLIPCEQTLAEAYAVAETVASASGLRRAGALVIVHADGTLAGIFTDGDLRRLVVQGKMDALNQPIDRVMTANPRRLTDDALVRDAVQLIREYRIDEAPIVDAAGRPVGLIDVQDLMALKVIEG